MQSACDEKKKLIDSMKKLAIHISNCPSRQKQIFFSLGRCDVVKIINNFVDDNQCVFLLCFCFKCCLVLYKLKKSVLSCQMLIHREEEYIFFKADLSDWNTKCNRKISDLTQTLCRIDANASLKKYQQRYLDEQEKMCWFINLDRKVLRLEFMEFKKYSSFTFLDPARCILGFSLAKNQNETLKQTIKTRSSYTDYQKTQESSQKKNSLIRGIQQRKEELSQQKKQKIKLNTSFNSKLGSTNGAQNRSVYVVPRLKYFQKVSEEYSYRYIKEGKYNETERGKAQYLLSHRENKPLSTRASMVHQTDNFYKKIKEILRK